jgi:hypothetical protein
VREHFPRSLDLDVGQLAREPGIEIDPVGALIDQIQPHAESVKQPFQRFEASAGKHEKLTLMLEAGDHA